MSPFPTETRLAPIGIVLALYPSDPSLSIEVQRAPDSGGSPGTAETIAIVTPGTRTYTDLRSGGTWHYRSRHVRSGANASAWTAWVAATPVPIPTQLPQIPDVGGWIIKQGRLESTDGNMILDAPAEQLRIGAATAPMTGTGVFIGSDGATGYDLRAGNPAGQYMHWDESAGELRIAGILEADGVRYGPLHADGSTRINSGNVTENTIETITVPAGAMGATGGFKVTVVARWQSPLVVTHTLRVKFGGTQVGVLAIAANTIRFGRLEVSLFNTSASAQRGVYSTIDSLGNVGFTEATSSIATASAADITITAQNGDADGFESIDFYETSVQLLASSV